MLWSVLRELIALEEQIVLNFIIWKLVKVGEVGLYEGGIISDELRVEVILSCGVATGP